MPIRSRRSSIKGQIEPEHRKLFALQFGKIAEYDYVYTLSSTNINHSTPNLVKMYCDLKISHEFDYGSNWTRTVQVICL